MNTKVRSLIFISLVATALGTIFFINASRDMASSTPTEARNPLFDTFTVLAQEGNSSCSAAFMNSITSMPDTARLKGSCCSKMSWHRYQEQVEGLKAFAHIKEIPPDPYDIEAGLAKQLLTHYDDELTPEQQRQYDFAMANAHEKGPCCCKCWRWYVYGGLAKLLIQEYQFTGEQITQVWNLSDGCGGEGEHVSHREEV